MSISNDTILVPVVNHGLTFNEVPDHLAVYFNLGDCCNGCHGCHSPELQEPMTGSMSLTLMKRYAQDEIDSGANAIVVLGGTMCWLFQRDELITVLKELSEIAPVALYSGDFLFDAKDKALLLKLAEKANCTWLKIGEYNEHLGGLEARTTNQQFLKRECRVSCDHASCTYEAKVEWKDITYKFWR